VALVDVGATAFEAAGRPMRQPDRSPEPAHRTRRDRREPRRHRGARARRPATDGAVSGLTRRRCKSDHRPGCGGTAAWPGKLDGPSVDITAYLPSGAATVGCPHRVRQRDPPPWRSSSARWSGAARQPAHRCRPSC
jgi:hypothetical protein